MKRTLTITEALQFDYLAGPNNVQFDFSDENTLFEITVKQCGFRTITIYAPENISTVKLLDIYYNIRKYLLLLDGHFYQIEKAVENGAEITNSLIARELPCYKSADFMMGTGLLFKDLNALTPIFLHSFNSIQYDLDISYKIMLHCISSVELPVDMKCAFLIETFMPLAELIQDRVTDFKLPRIASRESKLQKYIVAIITRYGHDIFCKECDENIQIFTQILTNSRNRIAHAKQKQDKIVLNGEESVLYLCKLSLLYRVVLFNLIGIPFDCYRRKLISIVAELDLHKNVVSDFIVKWKTINTQL